MSDRLPLQGPTKGECECFTATAVRHGAPTSCGLYGRLGKPDSEGRRHVRGCPCRRCLGRRNRRKGSVKQAKAVTALGIPRSSLHPGHEEFLGGAIRVECKSGSQVKPVWTRYLAAEAQSEAHRPFGDHRPFAFLAAPDGTSRVLIVVDMNQLRDFVYGLYEMWERDGSS